MKFYKRILCALLCCSLFLSVSLVSANADEVDHSAYHIYTQVLIYGGSPLTSGMIYPIDTERQNIAISKAITGTNNLKIAVEYYLANSDKTALYDKGAIVQGKLENIYFNGSVNYPNVAKYAFELRTATAFVLYSDNSTKTVSCEISLDRNGYYVIDFNFEAEKDVSQIAFTMVTNASSSLIDGKSVSVNVEVGEPTTATEANQNIVFNNLYSDVQSAEVGWLAKIWQKLSNGFQNIVDAIVNLPEKIGNAIKGLFVPEDGFFNALMDEMDQVMAQKFGALYQAGTYILELWDALVIADETDTINIPKVTIPLLGDDTFSFGGYDVKIVPDGFEFLATVCKTLTGMCGALLFIQGLRKRYESIVGG